MRKLQCSTFRYVLLLLVAVCFMATGCNDDSSVAPGQKADKIFVANEDGGTISVIDASTRQVQTIHLSDHADGDMLMPHNIQVAPDGKSVWVTAAAMEHGAEEQIIVIDPATNTIRHHIHAGEDLHLAHIVLNSESTYAFATANESNQILKIDAATYKVIDTFDLGANHAPHGLRYSSGKLYVANMDAKSISIIDVSTGEITELPVGGVAVQTAVTPDGNSLFASLYDTREIVRYDIHSGQITRIALPEGSQGPIQLYCTPDSRFLYVCDQGRLHGRPVSNRVYCIDIASSEVTNTITVGAAAHGIVISRDGATAYVTNSSDNTVSIINTATGQVTAEVPVGQKPNGISYWYRTGGMP